MNEFIIWSPGVTLEAIEKQVILKAFQFYRGNKTATAQALGIAIRTLDNKFEKYEVDGKAEKERLESERSKRHEFLARQRGQLQSQVTEQGVDLSRSDAGVRVESASPFAEKPGLSMPERKEVQGVLPGQASQSGPKKGR